MTINRSSTTIIGVMPEGFLFPQKNEMWVPLVTAFALLAAALAGCAVPALRAVGIDPTVTLRNE